MTADGAQQRRQHTVRREAAAVRSRRATLAVLGAGVVGGLAGCLSEPSFPDADVIVGPDSRNRFEPGVLTVAVGATVTWGFANAGHNVCCRPNHNDGVRLPDDAEGFASYAPDEPPDSSFVPRGETYDHTFEVPGQYDYVCLPHDDLDMTGTIGVE